MSKYPERLSPPTVPYDELLPAQKALLDIPKPTRSIHWLTPEAVRELGSALNTILPALMDVDFERQTDPGKDSKELEFRKRQLGALTDKLIHYGTAKDTDDKDPEVRSHVRTRLEVLDNYDDYYRSPSNASTTFTPEGLIVNAPSDFRQRIITVAAGHELYAAGETNWVNLSSSRKINLYTDNSSASLPFVEHSNGDRGFDDIFPSGRDWEPYFFHAVPKRFITESLALSVVEAIARVIEVNEATSRF